nr:hypothetical protein LTR18_009367 [Exophiala xenobiotica]
MAFIIAIWVAGVVLFARTRLVVEYESVNSYRATAGVGQFNGSYIPEYLQRYKDTDQAYGPAVLPYSTVNTASNLVVNPMHSTAISPVVYGEGKVCHSYLLSGGLLMTTPWPPTTYASFPVITLRNIPATQIDFVRGIHNDTFDDAEDCAVFGAEGFLIAMKFCLARSQSSPGSMIAGIFVCLQGMNGSDCWTSAKPPEVTTTFSIYQRHASITTSRSNFSILSVDRLDVPVLDAAPDVEGLKEAFNWLFNFTAANIPAPSSIAEYFWAGQDQLESEYWSVEPYQIFQSILAYPFWLFNPNNFGNVNLHAKDIVPGLPADFYTTASIGNPYERIVVDRSMFILFCVLQGLVQGFAWGVMIWLWRVNLRFPEASSYPIIDFAAKTRFAYSSQSAGVSQVANDPSDDLATAVGDRPIRNCLKGRRIMTCE